MAVPRSQAPKDANALPLSGGAPTSILLIEDEDLVRSLARRLLESKGYKVGEAASLAAARDKWRGEGPFDVILSDVQLPDGNSYELIRGWCQPNLALRVVFISGFSEEWLATSGRFLEGAQFLQKPFHPRELLAVIQNAKPITK